MGVINPVLVTSIAWTSPVPLVPVPPTARIDADPLSGLAPLTVQFKGDRSTGANLTYQWNFGDDISSFLQSPEHTYREAGDYTVYLTVTNTNQASNTASVPIHVVEGIPPTARIDADPMSGSAPLTVQFKGDRSTGANLIYQWNFGDDTSSFLQSPEHTYREPGDYTVYLTITDTNQASNTTRVPIHVGEPFPVLPVLIGGAGDCGFGVNSVQNIYNPRYG